jgi:hypothetical protein
MPIPGMTQFEMLQARGQAIWEQSRDGTPGINPLGEWQARFEGRLDGSIDNTAGKLFNHHHMGIKGGIGLLGAAGAIGAGEAYFDPHVARVMHNAAPWAAGALGLGVAGLTLNGMYAGKVKGRLASRQVYSRAASTSSSRLGGASMSGNFVGPPAHDLGSSTGQGRGSFDISSQAPNHGSLHNPGFGNFEDNNIAPDLFHRETGWRPRNLGGELPTEPNLSLTKSSWLSKRTGNKGHTGQNSGTALGTQLIEEESVSKGAIAYEGYLKPLGKLLGRGALKTGEKGFGMIGGALKLAGSTAGAAMHVAAGMELSSRALLTAQPLALFSKNTPIMSNNMLDAYLPNFRNLPAGNIMKYAPNPSIIRRATAGMWAAGAISMAHEMIAPSAPPPTAVFDGRYLHHKNDMGANAQYGQAILGRNSELMDPQKIGMYAAHLL